MDDNQIDWRETVEALLALSKRSFVPIDKSFVQLPRGNEERNSVLARFVRNGDRVLQGEHLHRATAVRPGIAELVPQKKRHNGGESQ